MRPRGALKRAGSARRDTSPVRHRKGGGKGQPKGGPERAQRTQGQQGKFQTVHPAKPSVAKAHDAYVLPPEDKQELQMFLKKTKERLDTLWQLREAGASAGKTENEEDTSEIACLKHMLFVAKTPLSGLLPETWSRITALEQQLEGVLAQEKEVQEQRRQLQASVRHFRQIYDEFKEESEERERALPMDDHAEGVGPGGDSGGLSFSRSFSHSSQCASSPARGEYGLQSLPHPLESPYPGEQQSWAAGGKGYGDGYGESPEGPRGWGDHSQGWGKGWNHPRNDLENTVEELKSTVGSLVEAFKFQQFTQRQPAMGVHFAEEGDADAGARASDAGQVVDLEAEEHSPGDGLYDDIAGYEPVRPSRHRGSTPYPESRASGHEAGSHATPPPAASAGAEAGTPAGAGK